MNSTDTKMTGQPADRLETSSDCADRTPSVQAVNDSADFQEQTGDTAEFSVQMEAADRSLTPSVHLPFEGIENCRDLAGMIAGEHAIRPGLLLRSGRLGKATRTDRDVLALLGITEVIDLRSELERSFEPDKKVAGVRNIFNPVLAEADMRRIAGGNLHLVEDAAMSSRGLMKEAYGRMMTSEDGIRAWRKLFAILMQTKGGVLFHCTQGKDRTGAAAALIEHALGVDEETILADYLQTNLYMRKDAARDRLVASALFASHDEFALDDISSYLYAHHSYYEAMNEAVLNLSGSWDAYLREVIGLDPSDLELLRKKYLC